MQTAEYGGNNEIAPIQGMQAVSMIHESRAGSGYNANGKAAGALRAGFQAQLSPSRSNNAFPRSSSRSRIQIPSSAEPEVDPLLWSL